jgi:hypothetical protein
MKPEVFYMCMSSACKNKTRVLLTVEPAVLERWLKLEKARAVGVVLERPTVHAIEEGDGVPPCDDVPSWALDKDVPSMPDMDTSSDD